MDIKNKCTMLVNSCDSYSDVWVPFFTILKEQWKDIDIPIVLNTESKTFNMEGLSIKTINVLGNMDKKIEWGERLIDVLNRIDTEYILFMLDDYLLDAPVQKKIIENCVRWMDADRTIVTFLLVPSGFYGKPGYVGDLNSPYPGFGMREKKDARLVAGPGIWRREELIKLTKPFEDPWVWELYGSMRARRHKGKFYCCRLNAPKAFVYDIKRGGAIHRGLWVGCYVRPLLERFNIDIDLEERGVDEDWLQHPPVYKKFDLKRIVTNRLKMLRSLYF